MSLRIGVVGQSQPDQRLEQMAREVGWRLAEAGCIVYCGGLGGVMRAACQGATEAGGITVGILPGETASDANPYVQIPITTGMGEARNAILVKSVAGAIAIGKGYGTLSEIALALRRGVPVVLLESWPVAGASTVVASAEEAVSTLLGLLTERSGGTPPEP